MGDTNDGILRFLQKHFVPLCVISEKDNKECTYFASAFVISVEEEWFLVTAGHVAKEINSWLMDPNYIFKKASLCDLGGFNAKHSIPIPFNLTLESFIIFGDENTYDYAVIHLDPLYIRSLEANGIEPLDEQVWLYPPENPEYFKMLGVTTQMVKPTRNEDNSTIVSLEYGTTLHPVQHSHECPDGITKRNVSCWYGYITTGSAITDIKGISGAPIFAFKHTDDGELKYWLIGVQSTWKASNKAIAVSPAINLGCYLSDSLRKFREFQAEQKIEPKTTKRGDHPPKTRPDVM
ncbi:hypothetical protein ACFL5H_01320 [Candidatus Latescibacterota bacterium]